MRCGRETTWRDGVTRPGGRRWRCLACGRRFTARSASACSRYGLPDDVIALAVRRYARFRLSHAAVAELRAERGFRVDRSTISRWMQRFRPRFGVAAGGGSMRAPAPSGGDPPPTTARSIRVGRSWTPASARLRQRAPQCRGRASLL